MLYMFQAVPPPIIRSPKLFTKYRVFVELLLLFKRNGSHLDVFKDKIKGLHQSNTSYLLLFTVIVSELLQLTDASGKKR